MSALRSPWAAFGVLAIVAILALAVPIAAASGSLGVPQAGQGLPAPIPSEGLHEVRRNADTERPSDFFVENAGQLGAEHIRFYAANGQVGFGRAAIFLKIVERASPIPDLYENPVQLPIPERGVLVRVTFEGSQPVLPVGRGEMPHRTSFFLGNDPALWRTGVRSFREVIYPGLYPGIDLVYRATSAGVKYEFLVRPGADPGRIAIAYEGVDRIAVHPTGELIASTSYGDLRDSAPISYQAGGQVACSFVLRGRLSVGFRCSGRDVSRPLVIDPLLYATYLGGGGTDEGRGIAVDATGNAYVTGLTSSEDFPATPGAYYAAGSWSGSVFVSKLDNLGSNLVYSAHIGVQECPEDDSFRAPWAFGVGIAVDSLGNSYVTGSAGSLCFPVTTQAFGACGRAGDFMSLGSAFVAKLDPTGSSLLYSACTGGWGRGNAIAVDSVGSAYFAWTVPWDPGPVTVAKVNPEGTALVYKISLADSIFWTSAGCDAALAVDGTGNAYVAVSAGPGFPTTPGSYDTTYNGGYANGDAGVAKINPEGTALVYSTFLGGSERDFACSIGVDAEGNAYITGQADQDFGGVCGDFPVTPGAYDTNPAPCGKDFVAKLSPDGTALLYSTYFRAFLESWVQGFAVDSSGNSYLTGRARGQTWQSVMVAKLNQEGTKLVHFSLYGGSDPISGAFGLAIAADALGDVYVTGSVCCDGTRFTATPGAFDTSYNGGWDGFVFKAPTFPHPSLQIEPAALDYGRSLQGSILKMTFRIRNSGALTLSYFLVPTADWIADVTPASGTSTGEWDPIEVTIDTKGLGRGTHVGTVGVVSNGGSDQVSVTVEVTAPMLEFSPHGLDLGRALPRSTLSRVLQVRNAGEATLSYLVSASVPWITDIRPARGDSTGEWDAIEVTVDTTGLAPGAHSGTVRIVSNGGPGDVAVTVQVITLAEAIQDLMNMVNGLNLPPGLRNSLLVKLEAALSSLERGNTWATRGQLYAFLNEVWAMCCAPSPGKLLARSDAEALTAATVAILRVL